MKNNRVLNAFAGVQNDRAPIWMMRQAGRYLPEFMEISRDFDFFEKCENPALAAEITLHPTARFAIDAAIIFADILTLPKAMGMKITMEPKEGPVIHNPLLTPDDDFLHAPAPEQLSHVYDALFLTRLALDGNQTLIGFCGAPWTVFAYLVEGKGSKLFTKAKKWLYLWRSATEKILDLLAVESAAYLIGQVNAGA
jgi:uroporphyrinogen decarboxylase